MSVCAAGSWGVAELAGLRATGVEVADGVDPAYVTDFGGLREASPAAVARPRTVAEAATALAFAADAGLPLCARGLGRSAGGQSLAASGALTLDLSRLDAIAVSDDDPDALWCEPGATWTAVVATAARIGRVPLVAPNYLDLTVGGTIAAGGYGASSFRHGAIAAVVGELDVATPAGGRGRCGPLHDRDRFDAVRGTFGRHGLILGARVPLRAAREQLTSAVVLHDDVADAIEAQCRLGDREDVVLLEGFCTATPTGFRFAPGASGPTSCWRYGTRIGIEHDADAPPRLDALLGGLPAGRLVSVERGTTSGFLRRLVPYYELLEARGEMAGPRPRVDFLLPWDAVRELLPDLLEGLPPEMGTLHPLSPVDPARLAPLTDGPSGEGACELVVMTSTAVPADATRRCLDWIEEADRRLLAAGGVRYPVGWLGDEPEAALDRVVGRRAEAWETARSRHDPQGLLRSVALAG